MSRHFDRVIVASNHNANYIQFWPLASKIWTTLFKAKITLVYVGPREDTVRLESKDNHDIEVKHVDVVDGIPTCFQAQMVRLYAPGWWYENQVCLVTDIDLFVVNATFFARHMRTRPAQNEMYVLNRYIKGVDHPSLCYHIGYGSVWKKLFPAPEEEWAKELKMLWALKQGQWSTDEIILHDRLSKAKTIRVRRILTPHIWGGGKESKNSVSHYSGFALDPQNAKSIEEVEPPFPYEAHRTRINTVLKTVVPSVAWDSISIPFKGTKESNRHPHKNGASSPQGAPPPQPVLKAVPHTLAASKLRSVIKVGGTRSVASFRKSRLMLRRKI